MNKLKIILEKEPNERNKYLIERLRILGNARICSINGYRFLLLNDLTRKEEDHRLLHLYFPHIEYRYIIYYQENFPNKVFTKDNLFHDEDLQDFIKKPCLKKLDNSLKVNLITKFFVSSPYKFLNVGNFTKYFKNINSNFNIDNDLNSFILFSNDIINFLPIDFVKENKKVFEKILYKKNQKKILNSIQIEDRATYSYSGLHIWVYLSLFIKHKTLNTKEDFFNLNKIIDITESNFDDGVLSIYDFIGEDVTDSKIARLNGRDYERIRWGNEPDYKEWTPEIGSPCGDCDTLYGEFHENGCDIERCPCCGGQFISCLCDNPNIEYTEMKSWGNRKIKYHK